MEEQLPMNRTTRFPRRPALLPLLVLCVAPWFVGCAALDPNRPAVVSTEPVPVPPPAVELVPATPATAAAASDQGAVAPVPPADAESFDAKPIDPVEPDRPVNLQDAAAETDLWARVRSGFAMPDLDTDLVRNREQWYANRPDYVQRMTERGSRYLFHVVEELNKRGMPMELALLPFIESAFNPQAMSVARASGMWQFMPLTGKDYDLKQNIFRDDRRDVLASTRAALDYLGRLHKMFGDWHLALAAYNWGEGNVQRAIARNQKAGLPTDYLSLRMPEETRYYVPKLQAVKNIVSRPEAFALVLPELKNHPYFLSVPIERDIDVTLAAHLADVSIEEFRYLNPQMNKPVILAAGTPQVLLPYDNANAFGAAVAQHKGRLASWTAWVAPKTMKTADAARHAGMDESELRAVNDIPPRMLVKAGSTLLVPRAAHRESDVSERIAENAMLALASDGPKLRRVAIKIGRKGDSVGGVARRFGVRTEQVAQWNKVATSARFGAGTTVVVYVPQRAKARPASRASRPAAARQAARKR
jgi:membrane-bound lytic murein transglycosylase D